MGNRILHVTPFYPPQKGGIASHVHKICSNLSNLGNDIDIICPTGMGRHQDNDGNKKILRSRSIHLPGWPYPTLRSFTIPLDLGAGLRTVVKKGSFDVIHAHGHHYPITWIAINAAHKYGIPVVLTLHGTFALNPYVQGGQSGIEVWLNRRFFPKILKKSTAIIGLTNQATEYGRKIAGQVPRYYTIGNGVDTEIYAKNLEYRETYRKKYGISTFAKVILFTGRLEHVKGILEFIQSAKVLLDRFGRDLEIVIAGGGALQGQVMESSAHKGLHILGWQNPEQIHELYIASNIFVLPSRFEALPITLIEAMNAGLHIVYTDVGGVSDVLHHYPNKTLLSEVSSEELTHVLNNLVSCYSIKESHNGPGLAYARTFDWKSIAARIDQVYKDITV